MVWSRISLLVVLVLWGAAGATQAPSRFITAAQNPALIARALKAEQTVARGRITGVTVPHHILAADLIARGLRAASGQQVDHILLIGPDHFRSLRTPFGVLTQPLHSVNGVLPASPMAKMLGAHPALFSDVAGAPKEHSIHAVTPFIASLFPGVPVTAITTATASKQADWEAAVDLITPHLGAHVLVVQSTDYSHFLPRQIAVQRDVETLGVIVAHDPQAVLSLSQPDHMDSKAAQYLQMRLQGVLGAAPVVIANRDAHDYVPGAGQGPTTSYVVTLYSPDADVLTPLVWPDQRRMVFGGDLYLGRGWVPLLEDRHLGDAIADLTARRGRGPFIANLEGVVLPELPAGANAVQHLMLSRLAMPALAKFGVTAVNTANNHSHDFGAEGLGITLEQLKAAGVTPLQHAKVSRMERLAILPLSFKRGYFYDHPVIRSHAQLDQVCAAATDLPVVVLTHWGADYTDEAGPFERKALDAMARCGVAAVIGTHTHRASQAVTLHGGPRMQAVFSMGNLLFDQSGDVSGALVELRMFERGTVALRLIPIPNYFEMARGTQ